MMYVQENEETMPPSDSWASAIDVGGKILICPTAGKKQTQAYGYNDSLANLKLGEIKVPTAEILTADVVNNLAGNIITQRADVDLRHTKKAIVSYVDSHVVLTDNIPLIFAKPTDTFSSNDSQPAIPNVIPPSGGWFSYNKGNITIDLKGGAGESIGVSNSDAVGISYDNGTITQIGTSWDKLSKFTYNLTDTLKDALALTDISAHEATLGWSLSFDGNFNVLGDTNHDIEVSVLDDSSPTPLAIVTFKVHLRKNDADGYHLALNGKDLMRARFWTSPSPHWEDDKIADKIMNITKTTDRYTISATVDGVYSVSFGSDTYIVNVPATVGAQVKRPRTLLINQSYSEARSRAIYSDFTFAIK